MFTSPLWVNITDNILTELYVTKVDNMKSLTE